MKKCIFLVAIVLFMHSDSITMKFWWSRSFGDLGQASYVSCLSTFSKGFFSKTTGLISFKFHMQPSSKGGKKVYIFHPCHMTKMATMAIYWENLKKSSSPEPLGQLPRNLVCSSLHC